MILKNTYVGIKDRKEPRTHFFTVVFPAINHWFEETVEVTGGEFSIIYIFINLFVNKASFKVKYISKFVFHCKKTQQDISKSHFYFSFPFLRKEM